MATTPTGNGGDTGGAREAILEAANRRFLRFGPRKTTMDEVAREAGCSRTTLYAHFRNKEDLYASLLARDAELFIEKAKKIVGGNAGDRGNSTPGNSARKKIRAVVELTRQSYRRDNVLGHALAGDPEMTLESEAHAFTRDQESRIIGLLQQVIDEGIKQKVLRRVDPERVAYLMFHLGRVLVEREVLDSHDYNLDEMLPLMDDVFARGILLPGKATR
jgi:AcrR family transcriptional regulator